MREKIKNGKGLEENENYGAEKTQLETPKYSLAE